MTNSIGAFRDIAKAGAYRVMTSDDNGRTVVKAGNETVKGRFFAWVKRKTGTASTADIRANRLSMDRFYKALKTNYGKEIADIVEQDHLVSRISAGGNLSSKTIRKALLDADMLRLGVQTKNDKKTTEFLCHPDFAKMMGDTLGKDPALVSPEERRTLSRALFKTLKRNENYGREMISSQAIRAACQEVLTAHRARAEASFVGAFPSLGGKVHWSKEIKALSEDYVANAVENLRNDQATEQAGAGLNSAIVEIKTAHRMMSEVPMTHDEIQAQKKELSSFVDKLKETKEDLKALSKHQDSGVRTLARALEADVDYTIKLIADKKEYLTEFDNNRPLSAESVIFAKTVMTNAALDIIDKELWSLKNTGDPEAQKKLKFLRNEFTSALVRDTEAAQGDTADKTEWAKKSTRADYVDNMLEKMVTAGVKESGLEKRFEEAHTTMLNKSDWTPARTTISFTFNGAQHSAKSDVVPARHVAHEDDPLTQSYVKDGLNGVSSETDKQPEVMGVHALNAATSTLRMGNNDKIVFTGVRHGVHCTRGLDKGSDERKDANAEHARETVKIALHGNPALKQQAIDAWRTGQVLQMPITSTSLLTPAEHYADGAEQWRDQKQAWDDISGKTMNVTLRMDDGNEITVSVRPKVVAFNFGVNPLAVSAPGRSNDLTALGWKLADATNKESLRELLGGLKPGDAVGGMVGAYLARNDVSPQDKQIARDLVNQIRTIWSSGAHRHKDGDIYKISTRIGVLTHRIDATPMWNCRSGKDRTGHLDAEMKMLAAEIELSGKVPPYGKLDDDRSKVFTEFCMHSGNHEIQRYNTGLPGYKTANMADNLNRLATKSAQKTYAAFQSVVPH